MHWTGGIALCGIGFAAGWALQGGPAEAPVAAVRAVAPAATPKAPPAPPPAPHRPAEVEVRGPVAEPAPRPPAPEEAARAEVLQAGREIGSILADAKGFENPDGTRTEALMECYLKLQQQLVILERHAGRVRGELAEALFEAELDALLPEALHLTDDQRVRLREAHRVGERTLGLFGIPEGELSGILFLNPVEAGMPRSNRLTPEQRERLKQVHLELTRTLDPLFTGAQRGRLEEAGVHVGWAEPRPAAPPVLPELEP